MAGGIGSRFWPASREKKPKQFLDILNIGKSLLRITFERFTKICPVENILIVTNENYRDMVLEQIPEIENDQILGESVGKNTAPCIAYGSYKIALKNPKATCVIAPSDHAIFNEDKFKELIEQACEEASKNEKLITLGIKPHKPETGYGYIQFIESDNSIKKVKTFTEKPEFDLAKKFVESGEFLWNAGIFIWRVDVIKNSFEEFLPDIAEIFNEITSSFYTERELGQVSLAYSQIKPISVDYGIMEKASNVYVIVGEFGWSDLGSWAALHDIVEKDGNKNYIDGDALVFNTKNSIIKGSEDQLIVVDGLKGFLVAAEGNTILICPKDDERKFRKLFSEVKKKKGNKYL